jgi:carboxylate-amine ligase
MSPDGEPISSWAAWPHRDDPPAATIGVEEELMLLSPDGWNLAQASEEVLKRAAPERRKRIAPETHEGAIEIETGVHRSVGAAIDDLQEMRRTVARTCAELGLRLGSSGTHPFTVWSDTEVGGGPRQAAVYGSMRELAHREPTFALHVHVGVPSADDAIAAFNRMRVHLPMLLALSADSPFWQGRDTGLASARTPLFQGFPRVGIPRRFADYDDWVQTVDLLVACDAFPDPSYLWWDIRMQPGLGTVEIRIMDAQIDTVSTASLVALVRCLVRMELREGRAEGASHAPQEVWEENRFIAARDGHRARLISPVSATRIPVTETLDDLMPILREHAADLDCEGELDAVRDLATDHNGAMRQRAMAERAGDLPGLVSRIADAL